MGVSKTSGNIHIKFKNYKKNIQKPPASSKAPNQDLKDMDHLCIFKLNVGSQSQDQDAKPDSSTFSLLQSCNQESNGILNMIFVMVNAMIGKNQIKGIRSTYR